MMIISNVAKKKIAARKLNLSFLVEKSNWRLSRSSGFVIAAKDVRCRKKISEPILISTSSEQFESFLHQFINALNNFSISIILILSYSISLPKITYFKNKMIYLQGIEPWTLE